MESLILAIALVAIVAAERAPALRFRPLPFWRPFFLTDALYFLTGALGLGLGVRAAAGAWAGARGPAGFLPPSVPGAVLVPPALVLYDLGAYVAHLLLHRVDVLWRLHKVHHSSRALDWLATFRAHILEHALRHLSSTVLLLVLGFPLPVVGIAGGIYAAWAAFGHSSTGLDLRLLEPVLITPRLHRLHHVPATGARNLGTVLSIWDRLRGALVTGDATPAEPLGVPDEIESYPQTWARQLVEPFRTGARSSATPGE